MTEKFELKEGKKVRINDIEMYYEEYGEGYPLILIHGGIGTSRVMGWVKQYADFAKHFRVIAPDSRGHGKTTNPSMKLGYYLMAKDVIALIDELKLDKPLICGWSDGGQIVLEIGIRHPKLTKALVAGGVLSEITEHYMNTMKYWGIEGPGKVNFERLKEVIPQFTRKLPTIHTAGQGNEYWKKLLNDISKMWCDPFAFPEKEIEKITEPILIIAGDRDAASSIEECVKMYKMIPNAELAIIPKADHDVYESKPNLFNEIVLEFLTRYQKQN